MWMEGKSEFMQANNLRLKRRISPWLVLAVVVIALGGCQFGRQPDPMPMVLPTSTLSVGTAYMVQRGPVVHTLRFNSKVVLAVDEELYFNTDGRVQAIYVESGDMVAADQVIAQLDTRDLEYDLADAQLALELARQRLAEAEEQVAFDLMIAEADLAITTRQLESLQAQVQVDPAALFIQELRTQQAQWLVDQLKRGPDPGLATAVERAELTLEQAQVALTDAQITAPFAGQVRLYGELEEGKSVEAYLPVATVVDPHNVQLEATLLDADLAQLEEGMAVTIELTNQTAGPLSGKIAALPQPFGSGVSPATFITVDEAGKGKLRAGMTVSVVVELDRVDDALWVPLEALHGAPDHYFVKVRDGDTVREVGVRVGIRNEERVQITQGIEEGQVVMGG